MCLEEEILKICLDLDEKKKEQNKKKKETETDELLESVYTCITTEVY